MRFVVKTAKRRKRHVTCASKAGKSAKVRTTKWKRDCYTTDLVTGPRESERKRERESTLLKSKLACPGKENDSEKW